MARRVGIVTAVLAGCLLACVVASLLWWRSRWCRKVVDFELVDGHVDGRLVRVHKGEQEIRQRVGDAAAIVVHCFGLDRIECPAEVEADLRSADATIRAQYRVDILRTRRLGPWTIVESADGYGWGFTRQEDGSWSVQPMPEHDGMPEPPRR